jgi:hypothetical protein
MRSPKNPIAVGAGETSAPPHASGAGIASGNLQPTPNEADGTLSLCVETFCSPHKHIDIRAVVNTCFRPEALRRID